jgi:hypothetical protein
MSVEAWEIARQKTWPIVSDAALDAIEDEAQARWAKNRSDDFYHQCINGLRSLRGEVAKMEMRWGLVHDAHYARLACEIGVRDQAIDLLTSCPDESSSSNRAEKRSERRR